MKNLKWKELAEVEEYLNLPMDEWTEGKSKAKLAFAMQYMMAKRNNPSLTIEGMQPDTCKALKHWKHKGWH